MLTYAKNIYRSDMDLTHPLLGVIVFDFAFFCLRRYGFVPTITSIIRPQSKDSGVHAAGRAIDFSRHRYSDKGKVTGSIPESDIPKILSYFNIKYPRGDQLDTIKYHDVGLGPHFHIQVAFDNAFRTWETENIRLAESRRAT